MRLRLAQYLKDERHIAANDAGGAIERWRWGRRALNDPKVVNSAGTFKRDGALGRIIEAATTAGLRLSESEARYRLRCARAYETESLIISAADVYGSWRALCDAGFPAVEVPAGAEGAKPYDPRNSGERLRDAVDELKRIQERPEAHGQLTLNLVFLPGITVDNYGPQSSLEDLWKAHEVIKAEVTPELWRAARHATRDDQERERTLRRLTEAAGGDRSATWEDASQALRDE